MKQTISLVLLMLLFFACEKPIGPSTDEVVLMEHLERMALKGSLVACDSTIDKKACVQFNLQALNLADLAVDRALQRFKFRCEDPPCDWPDTLSLAMREQNDGYALMRFRCEDPPCDWPDTLAMNSYNELAIGISLTADQSYSFKIVDRQNRPIAEGQSGLLAGSPESLGKKLTLEKFKVVQEEFKGTAFLLIESINNRTQTRQTYSIPVAILNE